ncbi:MAG: zinc ribbon domain-containing protein [Clostridia bacterium]|nr:zinc ribbon domain-containing protein [Clostridia bacterium]
MFCPKCGTALQDDIKYCPKCGEAVHVMPVNTADTAKTGRDRWESRVETVPPNAEPAMIDLYEVFGWELMSSQTIDTSNSHLENYFGTIYSVTESKNYVKLTFRRNKNMPNYDEYVSLERKYIEAAPPKAPENPTIMSIANIGVTLVSSLMAGPFGFVAACAHAKGKYKKEKANYDILLADYMEAEMQSMKTREKIIQEARRLGGY